MAPITKNHKSSIDHSSNKWQDAIDNALNADRTDRLLYHHLPLLNNRFVSLSLFAAQTYVI